MSMYLVTLQVDVIDENWLMRLARRKAVAEGTMDAAEAEQIVNTVVVALEWLFDRNTALEGAAEIVQSNADLAA